MSGTEQPDELHERGQSLWLEIATGRDMDGASGVLLLNACRIADRLDELTEEIGGRLTVTNDKGDEVASPLLTEHRQQLMTLNQILKTLGVGKLPERAAKEASFLDDLQRRRRDRQSAAKAQ